MKADCTSESGLKRRWKKKWYGLPSFDVHF